MPMIPPPIMSMLKIQVNHVISDSILDSVESVSNMPNTLSSTPINIKEKATYDISNNNVQEKSNTALLKGNNLQKLDLIQNTTVSFAKMVDTINVTAYGLSPKGFGTTMSETNAKKTYWYNDTDRLMFKSSKDCKIFENNGVRNYNGNVNDDEKVRKYVEEMSNNKANWTILLLEFGKAIWRLITKIFIFIYEVIQPILDSAVKAILLLVKILEEVFEWVSAQFQTTITVGSAFSQTSITTF